MPRESDPRPSPGPAAISRASHLLQYPGLDAAFAEPAPAGDSGVVAHHKVVVPRQADGVDVRRQLHRPLQLDQRQVVLERVEVVLGVDDLLER